MSLNKRTDYSLDSICNILEKMIVREHLFYNALLITKDETIDKYQIGEKVKLPVITKGNKAVQINGKRPSMMNQKKLVEDSEFAVIQELVERVDVTGLDDYCWLFGVSEEIRRYLQDGITSKSIESLLNYLHEHNEIASTGAYLEEASLTKAGLTIEGSSKKPRFLITSNEQILEVLIYQPGFIPYHQLAQEERHSPYISGKIAGLYVIGTDEIKQNSDGSYTNYVLEKYAACIAFSEKFNLEETDGIIEASVKSLECTLNPRKIIRLHVKQK